MNVHFLNGLLRSPMEGLQDAIRSGHLEARPGVAEALPQLLQTHTVDSLIASGTLPPEALHFLEGTRAPVDGAQGDPDLAAQANGQLTDFLRQQSLGSPGVTAARNREPNAEAMLQDLARLGLDPQLIAGLRQLLNAARQNGGHVQNQAGGSLSAEDIMSLLGQLSAAAKPYRNHYGGGAGQRSSARYQGNIAPSQFRDRVNADVNVSGLDGGERGQRLVKAIAGQESGGDPTVINRDAASADSYGIGAIGRYQMLGVNVANWSAEAAKAGVIDASVAKRLEADPTAITGMPEVQDAVAAFKMDQYYQEAISKGHSDADAIRYVAAAWYSGDGNLMNSDRPQAGYPSIRAYTHSVLQKFNALA